MENNNASIYKLKVSLNRSVRTENELVRSSGLWPKEPECPKYNEKQHKHVGLTGKTLLAKKFRSFWRLHLRFEFEVTGFSKKVLRISSHFLHVEMLTSSHIFTFFFHVENFAFSRNFTFLRMRRKLVNQLTPFFQVFSPFFDSSAMRNWQWKFLIKPCRMTNFHFRFCKKSKGDSDLICLKLLLNSFNTYRLNINTQKLILSLFLWGYEVFFLQSSDNFSQLSNYFVVLAQPYINNR